MAAATGLLLLAGCGFRPVYAPAASGAPGPAETGLAQVNVPVIGERSGQLLSEFLKQRLDRNNVGATKLYDLAVTFNLSQEGIATSFTDSVSTRVRETGTANWSLVSNDAERKTIISGRARSSDGFNPIDVQYFYTDLQSEQTQRRIAEALAEQIALQLATYFNSHPTGS